LGDVRLSEQAKQELDLCSAYPEFFNTLFRLSELEKQELAVLCLSRILDPTFRLSELAKQKLALFCLSRILEPASRLSEQAKTRAGSVLLIRNS
jgi:hypothetical protein